MLFSFIYIYIYIYILNTSRSLLSNIGSIVCRVDVTHTRFCIHTGKTRIHTRTHACMHIYTVADTHRHTG